uniref:Osteoclast-stimulating factor 1 n=1 Tax=Lepeophtheirus salmonis TaxID=72036 RepID=A0A0K2TIE9_LEPSM
MSKKKIEVPKKPSNITFKRALFSYDSNEADELSFKEGDLLYIIDWKSNQDWWMARLKSKQGLVPANYFTPIVTKDGVNPFLDACRRGNVELLEDCLSMRIPTNFQDMTGNTGLHYGAKSGHLDIVERLLLVPKIRLDLKNRDGDTPLHKSASASKAEICKRLLAHDSTTLNAKNKDGLTPYDLAVTSDTKAEFIKYIGHTFKSGYTLEDYEKSDSDEDNA